MQQQLNYLYYNNSLPMSTLLELDNSTWATALLANETLIYSYGHLLINFEQALIAAELNPEPGPVDY